MNKELMNVLYRQVGGDLSSLANYHTNGAKIISYLPNWRLTYSSIYPEKNDDFFLTEEVTATAKDEGGWKVVCTIEEYREFLEEIIYTIDLSHPLSRTVKVYDFFGNEITKVVKVEWTRDKTYVTILSEI